MTQKQLEQVKEDYVDIVFDGPPGPESGRFVEVENAQGKSISFGEWIERPDGYWALRVPQQSAGCPSEARERKAMLADREDVPRCDSRGWTKTDRWFLTHAIWRNCLGSYQPETGVRSVVDGAIQDDFRLMQHGCDQFERIEPIILQALDKDWGADRIACFIEWQAKRLRLRPRLL